MDRFIEKNIDKYFARKLKKRILDSLCWYYISKRIIFNKKFVTVEIKSKKWKEQYYVTIKGIPYEECYKYVLDENFYSKFIITLEERIEELIND